MKAGYVHVDTAANYNNEEVIGKDLQTCLNQGKKREDMYITTKIWHDKWDDVEGACRESLGKL